MFRSLLLALSVSSFSLALPTTPLEVEETALEQRANLGVTTGLVNTIVITVKNSGDWAVCPDYATTFIDNPSVYYSYKKYGTSEGTICHINSTTAYSPSGGTPIPVFTKDDAEVSKCMLNLHHTTGFKCISVKGSSCDNNYSATGGRVINSRIASTGKGESDDNKIAIDENNVGAQLYDTLIGQTITQGAAGVKLNFWNPDGNHVAPQPNPILLDFDGPSSPAC